jgi:rare lipoprotein A
VVAFESDRLFQIRAPRPGALGTTALLCALLLLSGCAGGGRQESTKLGPRIVKLGQPVPKGGGIYKVGSPYRLNGRRYVPREVDRYDAKGVASWYGEMFHGRRTANGEIYNMEALTAAHPTLPLPSLARVTNLDTGRSLVVRVNDRGPYVGGRAIDLSWAVASLLQVRIAGTAPVRIQYLGPAPLSGDDSYERRVLAQQRWAGPRVGFAASPAKAMRHQSAASAPVPDDRGGTSSTDRDRRAPAAGDAAFWPDETGAVSGPAPSAATAARRGTTPVARPMMADRTPAAAPVAARPPGKIAALAPARQYPPARNGSHRLQPAFVEAGLFPDPLLAERLAATLTDLAPVAVEPETVGGATLHRLRVGPFATQTEAEAAVFRMRAAGMTGAYLQPLPGG